MFMSSIIVDIDGTIADNSHRAVYLEGTKKDWNGFFGNMILDLPIMPVIHLIEKLQIHGFKLLFCTGRPEAYRTITKSWLLQHDLDPLHLYMRKDKDFRADHVIKSEILDQIYEDGFLPLLAIDDRHTVVDMWRQRGLICLQNECTISEQIAAKFIED